MSYNNVLENAYPKINLHDCEIKKMTYDGNNFCISFPEGFFLDGETRTAENARIVIKNLCIEDASFTVSKPYRLVRNRLPFYITRYRTLKDIEKLLNKGYYFTILKEYYGNGEILWRGEIESFVNKKIKNWGGFEFVFYSEDISYFYNDFNNQTKS